MVYGANVAPFRLPQVVTRDDASGDERDSAKRDALDSPSLLQGFSVDVLLAHLGYKLTIQIKCTMSGLYKLSVL
jgi:hypothetical protein